MSNPPVIDDLDGRLLTLLQEDPQIGVLGASRALGVARGTVQSRLDKLVERGVIRSFAPALDPAALGYPVMAFTTLEIRQGTGGGPVVEHVSGIAEVLDAHTITGSGDLMLRVVARDNAHLQEVIDEVVSHPLVERSSTLIALSTRVPYRTMPLVRAAQGP
ncbi:Lrp/AsnC family transcriptional regulator [Ornithinimicrobium sp. Y1847]|uniref:Lrp/AsnC family transcriptional regulator n=1 Tax=unclassified Ornithinimicrobium TaxID=2615080 RepID=UPI003B67996A